MRRHHATLAVAAAVLCATAFPALAQEGNPFAGVTTLDTRIGDLSFESGYPTDATVKKLYGVMDFQRASQAYIWGSPPWASTNGAGHTTTSSGARAARC